MGYRVDSVAVQIVLHEDFEGSRTISFSFAPEKKFSFDLDPVVKALLEQNDARLLAAAKDEQQMYFFF
jgi:hypothetical protein